MTIFGNEWMENWNKRRFFGNKRQFYIKSLKITLYSNFVVLTYPF